MKKSVFRDVKYCLYLSLILNGILVEWIVPLSFKCNDTGNSCPTCGLRTAVNLLLQGKFSTAYRSNKLIVVVVIAAVVMVVDVLLYLYRRGKAKQHRAT